ncbi:lysophospholipid acyltransferase family protein [Streptomyces sp. NPDC101160]|uniref:lysophospholipid acyltransferase family protein n=1 Tax=Streptomyces sp. NPDC101160 TaxID=3366118 RepID=UPI00382FBBC2
MSPWLPTAPCTPGRCAAHPGPAAAARGAAAGVLRLTAGLAVVLLGVVLSPLTAPLPAAGRRFLVRCWCRSVLAAFGVRIRVTGRAVPDAGPLLVVANHISWLDVPLIAAVLPGRMLAKREVRGWPVLGRLAALGGTLFIDRDRLRSLPGTVGAMSCVLAGGGRVIVFPEGSTWCGRARGVFRAAAFQAAVDTGSDIQPVRIDYTPVGAAAYVGVDTLGASLWRIATARRLVAEIRILDPISSTQHPASSSRYPGSNSQYPARRALARAAHSAVALDPISHILDPISDMQNLISDIQDPPSRATLPAVPAQPTVARESANLPASSVHQRDSVSPASASSARTPS